MSDETPRVGILMGSSNDWEQMEPATTILKEFGVPFEVKVSSAHRTPGPTCEYASSAAERGMKVLIAGAGMAAHLAGVLAAHTTLPVIGVPLPGSPLQGLDSLLATVQMPGGIPVATTAIGRAGAKNAGLLAVQMMALSDDGLADKLRAYKQDMARKVEQASRDLQDLV